MPEHARGRRQPAAGKLQSHASKAQLGPAGDLHQIRYDRSTNYPTLSETPVVIARKHSAARYPHNWTLYRRANTFSVLR